MTSDQLPAENAAQSPGMRQKRRQRRQRTLRRSIWKQPLAVTGLVLAAAWILAAVLAPWIAPADPLAQDAARFLPPSSEHWFGTDGLGRDVLSRVVHGARVSLPGAFLVVLFSTVIGGVVGAIAGYFGGIVDEFMMRVADLVFAFPPIILAMAVAATLGPNLQNAVVALVIILWPVPARVVRSLVLATKEEDYVNASRLLGASSRRTLTVDVLPNIAGPVAVLAMIELGNAVLLLSALSFLGLGAQPPQAEWGAMVATGARAFDRWWLGTFPGLAILTAVLAFNFLGDSLRDRLDPRTAKAIRGRGRV